MSGTVPNGRLSTAGGRALAAPGRVHPIRLGVVGVGAGQAGELVRPHAALLGRYGLAAVTDVDPDGRVQLPREPCVALVPVEIAGYETIRHLRWKRPEVIVVAGLEELTRGGVSLAFDAGAHGVISWGDPPALAVETVWMATQGYVPHPVALLLGPVPESGMPTSEECQWLRLLGAGWTLEAVAKEFHWSPSSLKRHLRELYSKLEVSGLREALVVAEREGWLR